MTAATPATTASAARRASSRPRSRSPHRPGPSAPSGPSSAGRVLASAVMAVMILYFLLPFWWLVVASTKGNDALFSTAALWFHSPGSFFTNVHQLLTYNDGEYLRWLANSALYAGVSGAGATVVATLAGYAFAKYRFPGRNLLLSGLLGAVMVPATALVIPTYLLLSKVQLTDTVWAVILPSLLNPFGVYLMQVYVRESLPDELLEAARMDGAGELRVFTAVALPALRPALVTVLLFSMVGTWNNFFLPLVMLNDDHLFPLTVGLQSWYAGAMVQSGANALFTLVVVGSLVAILPLVTAFLLLQRYWRGGLTVGSFK